MADLFFWNEILHCVQDDKQPFFTIAIRLQKKEYRYEMTAQSLYYSEQSTKTKKPHLLFRWQTINSF